MTIRRVLVTGASGKIGRSLIPALIEQGYSVRAVEFQTPVAFDTVEVVKGSVADRAFIRQTMEDVDAVCHLATSKEDESFLDVSIRGTFNLLDEARERGHIKQFVLASGDAALGIFFYPNPYPLDEHAPLRAYPGYYAFSKVLEETMCSQYAIQYGLGITILRFSWIQDQDDILAYMTLAEPNFGGPAWQQLAKTAVGISDVVQSFLLALGNDRAVGETFNIAGPSAFSYDVLSRYIADKLDLPVVSFELAERHDFSIDTTKARSVLGYRPKYDIFSIVDDAVAFRNAGKTRTAVKYTG